MAKRSVNEASLKAVADAIRAKGETTGALIFPDGMVSAIDTLKTKPDLQEKSVMPGTDTQTVAADSGYDGLSAVTVEGDADLIAANIKRNVEIFGVKGTYNGPGSSASTTTTARLEINGDDYTVNGAPQTGLYMRTHDLNETIALAYTGDKTFLHWLDDSGKVLGSGATSVGYTHTVSGTVVPVVLSEALPGAQTPYHAYIEFMSEYSQVVGAGTWSSSDTADMHILPKTPMKIGYKSLGWTLDSATVCTVQDIINSIDGSFAYKEIRGLYEKVTIPVTVTVANNLDDTTFTVSTTRGAQTVLTKPSTGYEGYTVHYWSLDKEGLQPTGYNATNSIVAPALDTTVYIHYVPNGTTVTRDSACAITAIYPAGDADDCAIQVAFVRDVMSGNTLNAHGILIAYGGDVEEETAEQTMVLGSGVVSNNASTSTSRRSTFTLNTRMSSPDEVLWARGYVVYTDANGVQHTMYSNIVSATWNELKAKDEEAGIIA